MSSPNRRHARNRALSLLSSCLLIVAFASWFAATQQAKNQSRKTQAYVASTGALVLDERGVTREALSQSDSAQV